MYAIRSYYGTLSVCSISSSRALALIVITSYSIHYTKLYEGNRKLLIELDIDTGALDKQAEDLRTEGQTVMFVSIGGRAAGLLGVADPIKPTTREAIRALQNDGIRIVMLTGDNRTTAEAVANKLGIDEVEAEVLPDQKADVVKHFQSYNFV